MKNEEIIFAENLNSSNETDQWWNIYFCFSSLEVFQPYDEVT